MEKWRGWKRFPDDFMLLIVSLKSYWTQHDVSYGPT